MTKVPTFFTFITQEASIHMEIPSAFTESINESLPEQVFVRDRNNRVWTVKVAKNGNCWSFVDGWQNFVKDNSLAPMDLLVFFHVTNNLFNVKIYGTSATEKNYISGPSRTTNADGNEAREDDDDDDKTNENENVVRNQALVVHVNNDENGGKNRAQGRAAASVYPKCYGMDIFEAGLAQRPQGPYFVATLMPKRISNLFIPAYVIKDYSLTLEDEITLVDPEGREFPSICKKWGDGRFLVSGGWKRLCGVNAVNQQHKCICEFLRREGDDRQFLYITFVPRII